jgi:hypothetical protein
MPPGALAASEPARVEELILDLVRRRSAFPGGGDALHLDDEMNALGRRLGGEASSSARTDCFRALNSGRVGTPMAGISVKLVNSAE